MYTLYSMEVPPCTLGHPDKAYKLDKGSARLWKRFITIMAVKGLLITCAHFLMRVNTAESEANPVCVSDKSTEREISQLHAEIQRLTTLLHNISTDSQCQLCPRMWHWFMGHCYFISAGLENDRKWAESVKYCAEHNASLAIIHNEAEMEFILGHLSRFAEMPFLWLGLTDAQVEGVWVWQDGTLLQNHRFIKVEWDSEHRDCADLRGDGSVFASECKSCGPWLCEKPMELPELQNF